MTALTPDRRRKAAERRAQMLAFYEAAEVITVWDVAEAFKCSNRWAAELLKRARNERDYRRIHK